MSASGAFLDSVVVFAGVGVIGWDLVAMMVVLLVWVERMVRVEVNAEDEMEVCSRRGVTVRVKLLSGVMVASFWSTGEGDGHPSDWSCCWW